MSRRRRLQLRLKFEGRFSASNRHADAVSADLGRVDGVPPRRGAVRGRTGGARAQRAARRLECKRGRRRLRVAPHRVRPRYRRDREQHALLARHLHRAGDLDQAPRRAGGRTVAALRKHQPRHWNNGHAGDRPDDGTALRRRVSARVPPLAVRIEPGRRIGVVAAGHRPVRLESHGAAAAWRSVDRFGERVCAAGRAVRRLRRVQRLRRGAAAWRRAGPRVQGALGAGREHLGSTGRDVRA